MKNEKDQAMLLAEAIIDALSDETSCSFSCSTAQLSVAIQSGGSLLTEVILALLKREKRLLDLSDRPLDSLYIAVHNHPDCVGVKIWNRADVAEVLDHCGFAMSQENVDRVILADIGVLDECFEEEWNVIENAVQQAAECGLLTLAD